MDKLYQSYVLTDDKEPFRFELKEITVKSISENGTIETKYPCFYGVMKCTNHINGSGEIKTDKEYSSGHSYVYYSISYEKCMEYLANKRQELFQKYQKMSEEVSAFYKKIMESEIKNHINSKTIKKYSLWMEGYSATGQSSTAEFLGVFDGVSFNDACDNWSKTIKQPEYYKPGTDEHRPSYWACKIFDNEIDARKSFG